MAASAFFLVGAVAFKAGTFIWLASIATAPSAVHSRREFLDHAEQALENLRETAVGTDLAELASIAADIDLLKTHVKQGWAMTEVFAAATRVLAWKTKANVGGALIGIRDLTSNTLTSLSDWLDAAVKTKDRPRA